VLFPNKFGGIDRWSRLNPQWIQRVLSLENQLGDVPADLSYGDPQLRTLDLPDFSVLKLGLTYLSPRTQGERKDQEEVNETAHGLLPPIS